MFGYLGVIIEVFLDQLMREENMLIWSECPICHRKIQYISKTFVLQCNLAYAFSSLINKHLYCLEYRKKPDSDYIIEGLSFKLYKRSERDEIFKKESEYPKNLELIQNSPICMVMRLNNNDLCVNCRCILLKLSRDSDFPSQDREKILSIVHLSQKYSNSDNDYYKDHQENFLRVGELFNEIIGSLHKLTKTQVTKLVALYDSSVKEGKCFRQSNEYHINRFIGIEAPVEIEKVIDKFIAIFS